MQFLQGSYLLWGLPILLVPILIHFLNRMRYKKVSWAAMDFLFMAQKNSSKFNKIKNYLVLLMRVLVVLLLLFILSRPVTGGSFFSSLLGKTETIIVLLDRSASMSIGVGDSKETKLDFALEKLKQHLKGAGTNNIIIMDNVSDKNFDTKGDLSFLDNKQLLSAGDVKGNISDLMQRAYNYISNNKTGKTEIVIVSDRQKTTWDLANSSWKNTVKSLDELPQEVTVKEIALIDPIKNNYSLSLVNVKFFDKDTVQVSFKISLSERAKQDREVICNLEIPDPNSDDDKYKMKAISVIIKKGSKEIIENYKFQILDKEKPFGTISLNADTYRYDNKIYFSYGKSITTKAYVVSNQNTTASRILESCIKKELFVVTERITPLQFRERRLDDASLVVWNAPLTQGKKKLEKYIEEGGHVLILPNVEHINAKDINNIKVKGELFDDVLWNDIYSLAEFGQKISKENILTITDIDNKNYILNKIDETEIRKINFYYNCELTDFGTSYIKFNNNKSFLSMKKYNKGIVYVLASSLNSSFSTLHKALKFYSLMIFNIRDEALKRFTGSLNYDVDLWEMGDLHPISNASNDYRKDSGNYQFGSKTVALNVPSREFDNNQYLSEDIEDVLGSLTYTYTEHTKDKEDNISTELWRIFCILLLLALIVEAVLTLNNRAQEVYL